MRNGGPGHSLAERVLGVCVLLLLAALALHAAVQLMLSMLLPLTGLLLVSLGAAIGWRLWTGRRGGW